MKILIRLIAAVACLAAVPVSDVWDEKPWTEWSPKETNRVLEKSPWARIYSFGSLTGPSIRTHVQWRSARPIRMAQSRMVQIREPGIAPKALLNAIEDPIFEKFVVVGVDFSVAAASANLPRSNPLGREFNDVTIQDDLRRLLQFHTAESVKHVAYLTPRGKDRIYATGYGSPKPGQSAGLFFFPRFDEKGEPMITLSDERVSFTFEMRRIGRVFRNFKLKELVFEGRLEL